MHFWNFGSSNKTACGLYVWAKTAPPETPYKANPATLYIEDVDCQACMLAYIRVYGIDTFNENMAQATA